MEARDESGKSTMPLKEIYAMHPEAYSKYDYKKFSSRLSSLRSTVEDVMSRVEIDKQAFENYMQHHKQDVSLQSQKGYAQWKGSEARRLLLQDIELDKHNELGKKELYNLRPEYYENYPFKTFCDKIKQEIRTAKYLHTCKVKGIQFKAS